MNTTKTTKKALVAFDYDGVLADTFEPNIRLMNRIFIAMGSSAVVTRDHFNMAAEISFEAVVAAAGLEESRVPEFMRLVVETGGSIVPETMLFPGMKEFIHELQDQCVVTIVSNNSTKIIDAGLIQAEAPHLFNRVTGSDGGVSKADRLREIQYEFGIDLDSCWMIGDGVNDIEAAHEAGWKSVAVTWGFQSHELLLTRKPTHIVSSPQELRDLIMTHHNL